MPFGYQWRVDFKIDESGGKYHAPDLGLKAKFLPNPRINSTTVSIQLTTGFQEPFETMPASAGEFPSEVLLPIHRCFDKRIDAIYPLCYSFISGLSRFIDALKSMSSLPGGLSTAVGQALKRVH